MNDFLLIIRPIFSFIPSVTDLPMHLTIMAPLHQTKFNDDFQKQLLTLKQNGVDSISTDIWWDHVEYKKNKYDWRNARNWLESLKKQDLLWIPILAFHTCGHNVNDDFTVDLPNYIKKEYMESPFETSKGDTITEYVSFWNNDIYLRYEKFIKSFRDEFRDDLKFIKKIYISMGPAGELRFPSYNMNIGWKYSHPGYLVCYSDVAKNDFQQYLRTKFIDINTLNSELDSHYTTFDEINPPYHNNTFFLQFQYTSPYGRCVLDWYQSVLHLHFEKMAKLCNRILRSTKIPLGAKLSGVHWKYHVGRLAEKATGYVDETYIKIIRLFSKHNFELTITCLEMNNNEESGIDDIIQSIDLVAKAYDVNIFGENALPLHSGYEIGWKNVYRNLTEYAFRGFTLLRWSNVFCDDDVIGSLEFV